VIDEAKSGVLFIDEAYRLSQDGGKSDFGREAIEQLMGAMNDPPGKAPVIVFAGYPDDMVAFMEANSGLYRRIAYTFTFSDYSPEELAQILDATVQGAGFKLAPRLTMHGFQRLAKLIETHTLPEARQLMNGGICERIFTFAKQALDTREASETRDDHPSNELLEDDIVDACARIPPPPSRLVTTVTTGERTSPADAWTQPGDVRVVSPPAKYEVTACCVYSCCCLRFFIWKFFLCICVFPCLSCWRACKRNR